MDSDLPDILRRDLEAVLREDDDDENINGLLNSTCASNNLNNSRTQDDKLRSFTGWNTELKGDQLGVKLPTSTSVFNHFHHNQLQENKVGSSIGMHLDFKGDQLGVKLPTSSFVFNHFHDEQLQENKVGSSVGMHLDLKGDQLGVKLPTSSFVFNHFLDEQLQENKVGSSVGMHLDLKERMMAQQKQNLPSERSQILNNKIRRGRPILGRMPFNVVGAAGEPRDNEVKHVAPPPKKISMAKGCTFCKTNGERIQYVKSHELRNQITGFITCPVLRKYVCPLCYATGDNAHTKFYCPRNNRKENPAVSLGLALKSTPRNSTHNR